MKAWNELNDLSSLNGSCDHNSDRLRHRGPCFPKPTNKNSHRLAEDFYHILSNCLPNEQDKVDFGTPLSVTETREFWFQYRSKIVSLYLKHIPRVHRIDRLGEDHYFNRDLLLFIDIYKASKRLFNFDIWSIMSKENIMDDTVGELVILPPPKDPNHAKRASRAQALKEIPVEGNALNKRQMNRSPTRPNTPQKSKKRDSVQALKTSRSSLQPLRPHSYSPNTLTGDPAPPSPLNRNRNNDTAFSKAHTPGKRSNNPRTQSVAILKDTQRRSRNTSLLIGTNSIESLSYTAKLSNQSENSPVKAKISKPAYQLTLDSTPTELETRTTSRPSTPQKSNQRKSSLQGSTTEASEVSSSIYSFLSSDAAPIPPPKSERRPLPKIPKRDNNNIQEEDEHVYSPSDAEYSYKVIDPPKFKSELDSTVKEEEVSAEPQQRSVTISDTTNILGNREDNSNESDQRQVGGLNIQKSLRSQPKYVKRFISTPNLKSKVSTSFYKPSKEKVMAMEPNTQNSKPILKNATPLLHDPQTTTTDPLPASSAIGFANENEVFRFDENHVVGKSLVGWSTTKMAKPAKISHKFKFKRLFSFNHNHNNNNDGEDNGNNNSNKNLAPASALKKYKSMDILPTRNTTKC